MTRSTFIFGASGFIGGAVARALVGDNKNLQKNIFVFKRPESNLQKVGIEGVQSLVGDLSDAESVVRAFQTFPEAPDVVFSAAYYPLLSGNAVDQLAIAQQQLKNVLNATPDSSSFLFVSSISTIGVHPDHSISNEDTPFDPELVHSTYYRIKYQLEKDVLGWAKTRKGRTVVVNPVAVFGEYDVKPTTSRIVVDAANGHLAVRLRGKSNVADIRDVAQGILAALEKGRSGERYILGGENTTVEEFSDMVCDVVGRRRPFLPLPFQVVRAAARVSESLHTLFKRKGPPLIPVVGIDLLQNSMHVSSEKARRELGYTHGPVRPAIQRAYAWFQKNGYIR